MLNILQLTCFDPDVDGMECTGPGSLADVKKETHFPQQTYLIAVVDIR